MGVYGSNQVGFILVGGYDVKGKQTTITDEVEALLENNHGLGDDWHKSKSVGLSKFTMNQAGFYDDAIASVIAAFVETGQGLERVFCYTVEGNVLGQHFVGFHGPVQSKVTRLPAIAALHKLSVDFGSNGVVETGRILHAHGSETATSGNTQSTPVDHSTETRRTLIPIASVSVANPGVVTTLVPHGLVSAQVGNIAGTTTTPTINGARIVTVISPTSFSVPVNVTVGQGGAAGTVVALSTVNGGAAFLQVESLTLGGYTNLAILVKHSSDNITYTTLATFAVVTVAKSAQVVVVAAGTTVKRYLAMSWSYGGAGSGPSFKALVGFARR